MYQMMIGTYTKRGSEGIYLLEKIQRADINYLFFLEKMRSKR